MFRFCLQLLSETFLILGRIRRYAMIKIHRYSCNVHVILVVFRRNLNLLDMFSKNPQRQNFIKISPVGAELFDVDGQTGRQTDRQTDAYDRASGRILDFRKRF
jgi:hypothetical protein